MVTRRFTIHGHVQGVGFRWWTRAQAERLAITGSVRNQRDGSVLVEASGEEESLQTFRQLLEQGPAGADVVRVDEQLESLPEGPAPTGFRILH